MYYDVVLTPDDNGTFLVTFPDFEEAVTFGKTQSAALKHARHALEEAIAARMAHKEVIPLPSHRAGNAGVTISAMIEAKLCLYQELQHQGLRKADLARRLKCNQKQVDRILDAHHQSTLGQLSRAFAALGKQLCFQVSDTPITGEYA